MKNREKKKPKEEKKKTKPKTTLANGCPNNICRIMMGEQ